MKYHEISDISHEISDIFLYVQYPMGYIQIVCVSENGVYCTPNLRLFSWNNG